MKRRQVWRLGVLSFFLGIAGSQAAPSEGQYQVIANRNLFNLKQPPERQPGLTEAPLPKFRLTGITTFGGKRAFVKMQAPTGDERSLILGAGHREGEIEILAIDERLGSVDIRYSGRPLKLGFEEQSSSPPRTDSRAKPALR